MQAPSDENVGRRELLRNAMAEGADRETLRFSAFCADRFMSHLQLALPQCTIKQSDSVGIDADWMEAIAFAWLAQQTMTLLHGNLPAVTGAKHPCVLGAIYPA